MKGDNVMDENICNFLKCFKECFEYKDGVMERKISGREKSSELIRAARELDNVTDYGNADTGMLNTDEIITLFRRCQIMEHKIGKEIHGYLSDILPCGI